MPGREPPFPGGLYLMGCHGGAGTTTLSKLGLGTDAGAPRWPRPTVAPAAVLLVARMSAWGLKCAGVAVETCISRPRMPEWLRLVGLIVVAAKPGRPPQLARERLNLVSGWVASAVEPLNLGVPAVHQIPWVPEALDTDQAQYCEPLRRAIPDELVALVLSLTGSTHR